MITICTTIIQNQQTQNAGLLIVKGAGTHSYHLASKVKTHKEKNQNDAE
jgi:phosphoribosylcarboxyaminoimidazole (NCAIR) mutase